MDLKEDLRLLLQKGYSAINELNKSSDMVPKQKILQQNGIHSQNQAKKLISNLHELVNAFDSHLKKFLCKTVHEKIEMLENHSDEIVQCVEYMSNLCLMAENLIKEDNLQVVCSFGPELKAEFLKSLKEFRELKLVDYDTFTSMDLEVDLSGIFKHPLVNIVSWNHRSLKKQIVHSLGFGSIEKDVILSLNQALSDDKCPLGNDSENEQCFPQSSSFLCENNNKKIEGNDFHQIKCTQSSKVNQFSVQENLCDDILCSKMQQLLKGVDKSQLCEKKGVDKEISNCGAISYPHSYQLNEKKGVDKEISNCRAISDLCSYQLNEKKGVDKEISYCGAISDPRLSKESVLTSPAQLDDITKCLQIPSNRYAPKQSQSALKSTVGTSSIDNNMKKTMSNAPAYENVKQEVCEIKNMIETKSGERFEDSFSDFAAANMTVDSIDPRNISSISVDERIVKLEKSNSSENMASVVTNTLIKNSGAYVYEDQICQIIKANADIKAEFEENFYDTDSRNISSLAPLEMTFDLRTVVTLDNSRLPEIYGEHVKTITGGNTTSFDHPTGLTVTGDGLVVVADTGHNLVKVMNNDMLVLTIGGKDGVQFVRPSAVVTDTEGNIYVKDDICVQIFDRCGKLLQTVGKSCFNHPYGLALGMYEEEPFLVLLDTLRRKTSVYNYFIRMDSLKSYPYGPSIEYYYPNSKVRFLALHDNTMLVSDLGASTMYLSLPDGQPLKNFGCFGDRLGAFKEPSGVTADAVGNWIVGDSKNNRLQVFTNDGEILAIMRLSSPIRRPSGIHLTSEGFLYVINYLDSVVKIYDLHL